MKSVDKQSRAQIEMLHGEIAEAARAVVEAHSSVTEGLAELFAPLEEAVATYNEKVTGYNELLDDAVAGIEGFLEGKSQRWHDDEKGAPWLSWKDHLEEQRIETMESPDVPYVPDPQVVEPEELPSFSVEDWE